MKFKKILRAVKSVVLSMAHMDYQMEFRKRKKSIDPVLAVALFLLAVYIATSIGSHPPDKPIQFDPLPFSVILVLLGVGIGKQIRKQKTKRRRVTA